METSSFGLNQNFQIYKDVDGVQTPFHNLVLRKSVVDSVVMSLGDKITGDVYYINNHLDVSMQEYVIYNGIKYSLVNPPTIVKEGIVSDNSELRGMTKYSFEFYHPMYILSSIPFTDVAVSNDEAMYLSENRNFSWMGSLVDYVAKLNKNLENTEWVVAISDDSGVQAKRFVLSDVLSFDNNFISDALKTAYDTWEVPFVIDKTDAYGNNKKFLILFGLPSNEIYETDSHGDPTETPFVFHYGKGVGLKNNSRTPKNNKIVTRIVGYGSENNIPYGYPQIIWQGDQSWEYTLNNTPGVQEISIGGELVLATSYPIYDGIVGGRHVRLIKHPFQRNHLMPSVYTDRVNKKVNPFAANFNPNIELVDYYDADGTYPNEINPLAPSCEIHEFEKIKPELGTAKIVSVAPYDEAAEKYISYNTFVEYVNGIIDGDKTPQREHDVLTTLMEEIYHGNDTYHDSFNGGTYGYEVDMTSDETYYYIKYVSSNSNFEYIVLKDAHAVPPVVWDDTMDDDGNYKQSYFKLTLPRLDFDIYACASITEEMSIAMRSGACIGCTFQVQVDWEDYKKNFFNADGVFDPIPHTTDDDGHVRDINKYPNSENGSITLIVQKDNNTFGILMPNTYQYPKADDDFVILGISLPTSYITNAEERLDEAMREYMLENNVYYYDYPLKFDEHFLATHLGILRQMRNNTIVRFQFGNEPPMALYIKQLTVKFGESVLPQYDITLTDDVEIVLNQIGQVTEDVSRLRVQLAEIQKYYLGDYVDAMNGKLSRIVDDVALGRITFQQGLNSIGNIILHSEIKSNGFVSGMDGTGRGWRIDQLGNGELESLRVRSYLEVVELLINRLQAQEGDTLFTDNDQIEYVKEKVVNDVTYYILTLKEKWEGYFTSQQEGNIVKGIINTLAANYGNVSDITEAQCVEADGQNKYYTSWMRVVNPSLAEETVGRNQIVVVLYGDSDVPAQRNFPPCELMTIARFGCEDAPDGATDAQKASVERRQRLFSISVSDGRISKLTGVNKPILEEWNYGTTLGVIPDFINNWAIKERLIEGRDYLYAQGVIVGDFIKVDINGAPLVNYVDVGEWVNGQEYLHNEYNPVNLQWETHDVWHNQAKWRCEQHQPVRSGSTLRYYEPQDNSPYWTKLLSSGEGSPVPYYHDQFYSWSAYASTNSQTTPPSDAVWSRSIPTATSGKPYLWLKDQLMTWNDSTKEYDAGVIYYTRITGEDGTGIAIEGSVVAVVGNVSSLPSTANNGDLAIVTSSPYIYIYRNGQWQERGDIADVGDCYVYDGDGHLWVWNGSSWQDVGVFRGEPGVSSYIHIAWANELDLTDQQTGKKYPSTFVVTKEPNEEFRYMGVYVDDNAGADSSDGTKYDWSEVKGSDAPYVTNSQSVMLFDTNNDGVATSTSSQQSTIKLFVGGSQVNITNVTIQKPTIYSTVTHVIDNGNAIVTISVNIDTRDSAFRGLYGVTVKGTKNGKEYTAYASITVAANRAGAGAIFLDLDNENDSMLYGSNDDETPVSGNVISQGYMYDNGNDVTSQVSQWSIVESYGCTYSTSIPNGRMTITGMTATSGYAVLEATYLGVKYRAKLTLKKLVGVDKYEIIVNPNALGYSTDVISTAQQIQVQVYRTTITGERQRITAALPTDYGLYYYQGNSTSGTRITSYSSSGDYWYFMATNMSSLTQYRVALLDENNEILDSETIPITKVTKGADGDAAVAYQLLPTATALNFSRGNDGETFVPGSLNISCGYMKIIGEEITDKDDGTNVQGTGLTIDGYNLYFRRLNQNGVPIPSSYTTEGWDWTGGTGTTAYFIKHNGVIEVDANSNQSAIEFCLSSNTPNATTSDDIIAILTVPITRSGEKGSIGKMGKNFYYAGEWNEGDGGSFEVTDYETPYFMYNDKYWVWVGDNGTYSINSVNRPSSSNSDWELMVTDFKYLITEAMFTKFAKLGAGIFNEDWMFSSHGNALVTITSIASTSSGESWAQISGQTAIQVKQGATYSFVINCKTTASGNTYTIRPYINDGSGYEQSQARIWITSSTTQNYTFNFVAERTGTLLFYHYGNGTTYSIKTYNSSEYNKVTPSFMNADERMLLDAPRDINTTTHTRLVETSVTVVSGLSYRITVKGYANSGTLRVRPYFKNSSSAASSSYLSISSRTQTTTTYTFTPTSSGDITIDAYMSASGTSGRVEYMSIRATNPFIPRVAIDWRSGYAHFGGDNIRFNPDGSGFLANKNITWDENGNCIFSGLQMKRKTVINSSNYLDYLKPDDTWGYSEYVFDFEKASTWMEIESLPSNFSGILMPISGDFVRSLVGQSILLYNKSSVTIPITGKTFWENGKTTIPATNPSFNSTTIAPNCFVRFECKITIDGDDNELLYWSCVRGNISS